MTEDRPSPLPADGGRRLAPVVLALVRRPHLWWTAGREVLVLARSGWWRRWPPLPRPDEAYLRFRFQTAYGDPELPFRPGDVVDYLEWCHRMRQLAR